MYFQDQANINVLKASSRRQLASQVVGGNRLSTEIQQNGGLRFPDHRLDWVFSPPYGEAYLAIAVILYQYLYQTGNQALWAPLQRGLVLSGVFPVNPDGTADVYTVARATPGDFSSLYSTVRWAPAAPRLHRKRHAEAFTAPYVAPPPPPMYVAPPPPRQRRYVVPPPSPMYAAPPTPPPPMYVQPWGNQRHWHRGSPQGALDPKSVSNRTLLNQRASNLAFAALRNNTGAIQMIQSVRKMANRGNPIAQSLMVQINGILQNAQASL